MEWIYLFHVLKILLFGLSLKGAKFFRASDFLDALAATGSANIFLKALNRKKLLKI